MILGHVFGSGALFCNSNDLEILIPVEFNMADRTVLVVLLSIAYILGERQGGMALLLGHFSYPRLDP